MKNWAEIGEIVTLCWRSFYPLVISEGIDIDQHEANITSEKPQFATIFDLKADLQSVKVLFFLPKLKT